MAANTTATNGQTSISEKSKAGRSSKSGKRSAAGNTGGRGYGRTASRFMSQGKQALGDAYGWASEGAGRAFPRASSYVRDHRNFRNLIEERPLMIGAIGLGLGAIIGMMLPSRLMGKTSRRTSRGSGRVSGRAKSKTKSK